MGEAELAGDIGHGTPVQKEGTQGLVLTVLGLAGFAKELLAAQVIPDRSSKMSHLFRANRCENGSQETPGEAREEAIPACLAEKIPWLRHSWLQKSPGQGVQHENCLALARRRKGVTLCWPKLQKTRKNRRQAWKSVTQLSFAEIGDQRYAGFDPAIPAGHGSRSRNTAPHAAQRECDQRRSSRCTPFHEQSQDQTPG